MNNTVWLSPVYFNPQIVQEINFIICQISAQSWRTEIGKCRSSDLVLYGSQLSSGYSFSSF